MLTILQGDALERLAELPAESVQCCVTSPPYWGLRDYGTAAWGGGKSGCDHKETVARHDGGRENVNGFHGSSRADSDKGEMNYRNICGKCGAKRIDSQLGLEKTPEEYVTKMVEVFREVRRVLRKDGTLWLNLGDSFNSSPSNQNGQSSDTFHGGNTEAWSKQGRLKRDVRGLKPKDLCGIPWRVAFALQADGWWLRSDIIWSKPNPMPESCTDRPTKAHEYLFLLTKSASYFYDAEAIREPAEYGRREWSNVQGNMAGVGINGTRGHATVSGGDSSAGRNKRSVWTVATAPYPEAHFATYPPDLIKPCIMAGTSAKGCCAKCGAPWERIVDVRDESRQSVANPKAISLTNDSMRQDGMSRTRVNTPEYGHAFVSTRGETLGWQPTCKCRWFRLKPDVPQAVIDKIRLSIKFGAWRNGFATNAQKDSRETKAESVELDSARRSVTTHGEPQTEL